MVTRRSGMFGAILLIVLASALNAQQAPSQEDQQKMMEVYMKLGAVNENHEYLKNFVGEWEVSTKGWVFPGTEPVVSQGTSKYEMFMTGPDDKEFKTVENLVKRK